MKGKWSKAFTMVKEVHSASSLGKGAYLYTFL